MGETGHYKSHNLVCLNILQEKVIRIYGSNFKYCYEKQGSCMYLEQEAENSDENVIAFQEHVTHQNLNKCAIGHLFMLMVNFARKPLLKLLS